MSRRTADKLQDQITCPVCLGEFTNPKVLPCLHPFCLSCLQLLPTSKNENGKDSLDCPSCRRVWPVPDEPGGLAALQPFFLANQLKEIHSDLISSLDEEEEATLTDGIHPSRVPVDNQNVRPNANPSVTMADPPVDTVTLCTAHNKPLDIFCDNDSCQQLICRDCTVRKHRDHDYDLVVDCHHTLVNRFTESTLYPLNSHCDRLQSAKQHILEKKDEIALQLETTRSNVYDHIEKLQNELDEAKKQMIRNADSAASQKFQVLDSQIVEIDEALNQVVECKDDCNTKIADSAQSFLQEKHQIMSHAQSVIACIKEKTFEPLEQPDIQLVVKSNEIQRIHDFVGKVHYTTITMKSQPVLIYQKIPLLGKESVVNLSFNIPDGPKDGSLVLVPCSFIKCHVTPPDDDTNPSYSLVQCSVKSSRSGQYNILFTPLTRGLHHLHITVGDNATLGSPFSIPVTVPPEMRGNPVKIWDKLKTPSCVVMIDNDTILLSEFWGHKVLFFNVKKQKVLKSYGGKGGTPGKFQRPQGIAIVPKVGSFLVADCKNHRLQKFSIKDGYESCIGSIGNGPLQFCGPRGITINKTTGQVFIADTGNHRIQVLHPDLTFSHSIGSEGSRQGHLHCPHDVTNDSQGFVYVTDFGNHRIQKFTSRGQFVSSFGGMGSEPDQLLFPSGITIDETNGLLYVNNSKNIYVTVFTTDGQYVTSYSKDHKNETEFCALYGITYTQYGDLFVSCTMDDTLKLM